MTLVLDTAQDYSRQASKLIALGVGGVMRYFNPLTNGRDSGKSLTASEAKAWAAANMPVGIVVEGWGLANGTGVDALSGARDATEVLNWLPSVGIKVTSDLVVYFAVDTDASTTQINQNEVAYFDAIASVFAGASPLRRPKIGIYGSGASCLAMLGTNRAKHAWVAGSTGWTGYQSYVAGGKWTLLQKIWPGEIWQGFSADTNQLQGTLAAAGLQVPFAEIAALGPRVVKPLAPTPSMNPPVSSTQKPSFWSNVVDAFKRL